METKKITHISNELKEWIIHTLNSGAAPESIVDAMIKKGFDPRFSYTTLFRLVGNHSIKIEEKIESPYFYEQPGLAHKGNVIHTSDHDIKVLMTIDQPYITFLDHVLSNEECDELISLSKNRMVPSKIVDPTTGKEKITAGRTSEGTYYSLGETPFIRRLENRIAEITGHPILHGEGLQVLHYHIGEEYKPHFDYFPANRVDETKGGQRVGTFLMYLNDVESGGETVFPKIGLSVKPKKGSAVYFHYGNSQGQVDRNSLHSSVPVLEGEKWVATKWIRQGPIYSGK